MKVRWGLCICGRCFCVIFVRDAFKSVRVMSVFECVSWYLVSLFSVWMLDGGMFRMLERMTLLVVENCFVVLVCNENLVMRILVCLRHCCVVIKIQSKSLQILFIKKGENMQKQCRSMVRFSVVS